MKKILLVLLFGFSYLLLSAQPILELAEKTHKFPKTKEGVLLKHNYKITNEGNEPLLLSNYEVACSCTKLEFSKSPILPKQSVELIVSFDTNHKIGWQDRIITLYSNANNSPTKIRFKVMVDND